MKQGLINDLTRYILPCYCVLSEQFIGRFLSGKIHFYHMKTRLYRQSVFIHVACAEACNPAEICYLCRILICRLGRTTVCHNGNKNRLEMPVKLESKKLRI